MSLNNERRCGCISYPQFNDYLYFDIDVQTGKILNWNVPTQQELQYLFKEEK